MISERLGHSTAAFTLQTYTHVIPGMDAAAADTIAALLLGGRRALEDAADESIVHGSVHTDVDELPEMTSGPAEAGPDTCSGGTAQICARSVARRHSPAAQGVCQGICHPLLIAGSNHGWDAFALTDRGALRR